MRQRRAQCVCVLERRQLDHPVAGPDVWIQARQGCRSGFSQIAFVEQDERAHVLALGRHQAAVDQLLAEAGLDGDHDRELRDVGGDQLLPVRGGARKEAGARVHRFDHALLIGGLGECHAIAAGDRAFLAARKAGVLVAVRGLDQVMPAVGCDHLAREHQIAQSASIFAAQIKSFSEMPPVECVL